ncbi:MAG: endopeptidase La [Oscillospiraceae bacterium]|nr:endopeptidase La [Oscillospiraceae bacterium]
MPDSRKKTEMLPTVPLRGTVAFPHMIMHFDVAREMSVQAVEQALGNDRRLFLVAQRDVFEEEPSEKDLYQIGVVAEIKQTLRGQDETVRVLVEGLYRAFVRSIETVDGVMVSQVKRLNEPEPAAEDAIDIEAMVRAIKGVYERYAKLFPRMPKENLISVMCQDDPVRLYEQIAFNTMFDHHDKQELLEENSVYDRLNHLYAILTHETMVLEMEKEIHDLTQESIDQGQREYFLREQMRIIGNQLKEETGEAPDEDIESYMDRIDALPAPEQVKEKLMKEASRLRQMPPASQEAYVVTSYLDTVLDLPWEDPEPEKLDLESVAEVLDADHFGLQKVKERILETLAVRVLNPDLRGQILCLVGPPGIGKSSVAKSVAGAIGRRFARVSLGGVRDEADIRGHRKTYIGAMPGRIIAALQEAGTRDPLILLDELDKMGYDYKGDPSAAMLEVLDTEQNHAFRDHYLEVPFDLSKVMFIATANTLENIPAPLRDRMDILELPSYTREEKFQIAVRHLVAKQREQHGLTPTMIRFADEAIYEMIDGYTKEAGVRNLERTIATVCRKVVKTIATGERKRVTVKKKDLKGYLGIPRFLPDAQSRKDQVGVVNGLAWTSVGGVLMPLEAVVMEGNGKVQVTGSLGQVMQESAQLAVTYARLVADRYKIDPAFLTRCDIHIHAPEGAVPKDGPSAGVSLTTALISALSGIPVRADVAMTGEVTLHGKVMPIGGLREKSMAAYKAGIKTVIIPEENRADLEEVDPVVKENVTFVPVTDLRQVLETALAADKPVRTPANTKPRKKAADPAKPAARA